MTITVEQVRALEQGKTVDITINENEYVLLPREMYEKLKRESGYDDREMSPREAYGAVEKVMAEDDTDDPSLESYQQYERE